MFEEALPVPEHLEKWHYWELGADPLVDILLISLSHCLELFLLAFQNKRLEETSRTT